MPLNPHVRAARDFLVQHRSAYEVAAAGFRWPELPVYNFATDWFDGKTKVNWATPWYYPEVTQGKKYDGLGLIGFRTRAELPNVVDGMLKRNYSAARIEKLLGGNFIRVLKEVWK